MPGEGLTHGPPADKKAGGSHHRCSRSSGIPCAMGYGLYAISPGRRAFLPPSPAGSSPASLTSASGGQDHATSPSASAVARPAQHPRPPHPRLTCRDDWPNVPLHRGGMRAINHAFLKNASKIFRDEGRVVEAALNCLMKFDCFARDSCRSKEAEGGPPGKSGCLVGQISCTATRAGSSLE
jgi:hypothetical protein